LFDLVSGDAFGAWSFSGLGTSRFGAGTGSGRLRLSGSGFSCSRWREVLRVGDIALRDGQPACTAVALTLLGFPAPRTLTSDARAKRELWLAALVTRVGPARDVPDPENRTRSRAANNPD
jgi:hypothetical protein